MAEEIVMEIKTDTKEVSKLSVLLDKIGGKIKSVATGFGKALDNVGQKFEELPGPIGAMSSSLMGLGKSMLALIANPIGLFLTAVVGIFLALKSALTKTEEGMNALQRITAVFGAILRPVVEMVSGLATILVDGLANGLELVGSLFGSAATEASKLVKMQQEIGDEELILNEIRAKSNKELAQARELLSDTNASLEDRRKALEQVRKSETDIAAKEVKFAQKRLDIAKLDAKLNGATEESKKAISEAIVQMQNAETELASKRRSFNKEAQKLDKEEKDRKDAAAKAEEERLKELAAKQKEYAEARRNAADKIREADRKNIIDSIKDEEAKARKQAEFDLDNAKREINRGQYTAKEKARLIQEAEEANQIKLTQITDDAEKKKLDSKKKADEELKAFMEKSAQDEAKFIDEQYAKEQLRLTQTITNEKDLQTALTNLELDRLTNQIQARKDAGQLTTDLELSLANKRIDIAKNETKEKEDLSKKEMEAKMAIFDATSTALSSITQLVGESTAMGKSLAVAQAIIDTYTGATKAFAQGGVLGYIGAAGVIAAGLANVRKIVSTQIPGQPDAGGMPSQGPSVSIIGGTADPSAQMAASLNKSLGKPAKAYVVGNDMSSQQALDRRIQTNATFPG
jgi:chemotaxis protein histidine kinase CheA